MREVVANERQTQAGSQTSQLAELHLNGTEVAQLSTSGPLLHQPVLTLMRFPASGLTVNQPGDRYEQEAERMADRVMRMPAAEPVQQSAESQEKPGLQRKCASCEEEEKEKLHRKETGVGPATAPPIVHEVLSSPGQPLDAGTRAFMEPRFGHDFSRVQVHSDDRASQSASAVKARAYTVGNHIAFAQGQYALQGEHGRRLLAHELTHVIQQGQSLSLRTHKPIITDSVPVLQRDATDASALATTIRAKLQSAKDRFISSRAREDVAAALDLMAPVPESALDSLLNILNPGGLIDVIFQNLTATAVQRHSDLLNRIKMHRPSSNTFLGFIQEFHICETPDQGIWQAAGEFDSVKSLVAAVRNDVGKRNARLSKLGILAHGNAGGVIYIGDDYVNPVSLDRFAGDFREIAQYLTPDADVLIYGCASAASSPGSALFKQLSGLLPGRRIIGFNVFNAIDPKTALQPGTECSRPELYATNRTVDPNLARSPVAYQGRADESSRAAKWAKNGSIIHWPSSLPVDLAIPLDQLTKQPVRTAEGPETDDGTRESVGYLFGLGKPADPPKPKEKAHHRRQETNKLHRKESGAGPATAPPIVHDVLSSPGQPLDAGTRAFMEPRFGHDFSRVRVHTDAGAAESARAVNSLAYTAGPNIVFANTQYEPHSSTGRRLLSHELAHVIQQQGAELSSSAPQQIGRRPSLPESSTQKAPTRVFRQVAPSPVARRSAVQIFGDPAAAPPSPGMTLSEFKTYTQLQSDWFVEPSLAAGANRDDLWKLLLRIEEGPHILSGIGDVHVSDLRAVAVADWAPLVKFCQGTHATGHTVRIFPPLPALAERIDLGRTLIGLEAVIPANVLEVTVSHSQLVQLKNQGLLPLLTNYWHDYEPHIEQNFTPVAGARGPEFDRVLTFLNSLGAPGLGQLADLRGAVPDERWVRNLHRFPLLMLKRLVTNLTDHSGTKRLILVLHTGHDAAAAFQDAANLFRSLVLLSPGNLVLMIEGATSLAAITARIPNITATWGKNVGGVRRISQVVIAGHGSTQTVGMAGTGAPVVHDGAVEYPEEDLVAGQPVGAPPTPTTALLDALMHNMPPATARILYVGCLVGAADVAAGTAAADIPAALAAQQNLGAFTEARATAAGIPAGRVQAARASVGVADIQSLFDPAGNLKAKYDIDPNAFGPANTYAKTGREPEGVLRAAVEVGATSTVTAETALRTRLAMAATGDWYDTITRLLVRLALPGPPVVPPAGVDLQRVNEMANVAEVPFLIMWPQFAWINAQAFRTRLNPQPFAPDVYAGLAATAAYMNPAVQHTERLRICVDQGRLALAGAPMAPTLLAGILATDLNASAFESFLDLPALAPNAAALLPLGVPPTTEQIRLALAWFSRDPANVDVRNFLTQQVLHPPNAPAVFTPAVSAQVGAASLNDRDILEALHFGPNAAAAPAAPGAAPLPIANAALTGDPTNTILVTGRPREAHVLAPVAPAPVRNGPSLVFTTFTTLPNGTVVRVMGSSGGWAAVDVNGRLGFMVQGELSPP